MYVPGSVSYGRTVKTTSAQPTFMYLNKFQEVRDKVALYTDKNTVTLRHNQWSRNIILNFSPLCMSRKSKQENDF